MLTAASTDFSSFKEMTAVQEVDSSHIVTRQQGLCASGTFFFILLYLSHCRRHCSAGCS